MTDDARLELARAHAAAVRLGARIRPPSGADVRTTGTVRLLGVVVDSPGPRVMIKIRAVEGFGSESRQLSGAIVAVPPQNVRVVGLPDDCPPFDLWPVLEAEPPWTGP